MTWAPKDSLMTMQAGAREAAPDVETGIVRLVSVNVALPRVIGTLRNGQEIVSGIAKQPVAAETLLLAETNLEGDRQADLSVHGGPDKAVYAYPSEHLPVWNDELGTAFGPGTFGENLTTAGILEDEVRIGDLWAWGAAVLQVAQPRSPCYKLAAITGRPDIGKRLVRHGRTGWYLRVLRPGAVPVAGAIRVIERHPAGVTVLDAHRASLPGSDHELIARVVAVEPLAAEWKGWLVEAL
jgi:MOSC domain-containing protein YiiM